MEMDFESFQEKMETATDVLEKKMLDEKPWYLRGEIIAQDRAENTLLEEHLDVQRHGKFKPPPANEEIIVKFVHGAIKERLFDSPVLKSKPTIASAPKPRVIQDVVQKSLVEDYESLLLNKDLLQKVQEDPLKQAVQTEMLDLFDKLDGLVNLHFVPDKQPIQVSIIQNNAALSLEELGPVATSVTDLLAPEEVCAPRGEVIKGTSEQTNTDKRRHRRKLMRIRAKKTSSKPLSAKVKDKKTAMAKVIRMAHKPGSNIKILS